MALPTFRRVIASRQLGWLLALALWLPMAQWAAATHTLLHLQASVSEQNDRPAQLPDACETCVVVATMVGAVPASGFSAPLPLQLPATQPQPPQAFFLPLPQRTAYDSRAPPSLHA